MGQPIVVTEKPGLRHGTVRFELNRNLTGMGHLRYTSPADATGARPPDELARRLFATGKVLSVHVYMSVVTVELASGATGAMLKPIVEDLYRFYPERSASEAAGTPDESEREAATPAAS